MGKNKTSISGASSYREIGEFWDEHDLSDYWNQTHDVQMDVTIDSSTVYFPVEKTLPEKLRTEANSRGRLRIDIAEHLGSRACRQRLPG